MKILVDVDKLVELRNLLKQDYIADALDIVNDFLQVACADGSREAQAFFPEWHLPELWTESYTEIM